MQVIHCTHTDSISSTDNKNQMTICVPEPKSILQGGGGGKLNSSFAVSVAVRWNPAKGILECFKLQSDWQGFLVLNAEYYMWVGLPPQIKTFQ